MSSFPAQSAWFHPSRAALKKITLHVSAHVGRNAQTCTSYVCNFCSAISNHRTWEYSTWSGNLAKTYLIEFLSTSQHPSSLVYNRWRVIIVDKMPWQPFKLLTNISCIFVMLNPCSYTGSLLYWCPKQIKVTWRHTQWHHALPYLWAHAWSWTLV